MRIKDYREYFKTIAINNITIGHDPVNKKTAFKTFDVEQVINAIKVDLKGLTLFAENPRISSEDEKSDNPRKICNGAFLVMEPCSDPSDWVRIESIQDKCEEVSEEILSKILNDVKKYRSNKNHPFKIKGFDVRSVQMETINNVFNGWYGWRTSFTINSTFINNLILDETKWRSDKPFTI